MNLRSRVSTSAPRVVFLATGETTFANGCTEYLCDELVSTGYDVHLITPASRAATAALANRCRCHVYPGTPGGILGRRKVRWATHRVMRAARLLSLRPFDAVVFTNYLFVQDALWVRRVAPTAKLVHYALEFYRPTERWPLPLMRLDRAYRRTVATFDLHIDVNEERARQRALDYRLPTTPTVLPNSAPLSVPALPQVPRLSELARISPAPDVPVLVYAGGNGTIYGIEVILDALAGISRPFLFVAFMYEGERSNAMVAERARQQLGAERVRVVNAVPRHELREVLGQADCAIGYYDRAHGSNFEYCAPTKVYEYIAAGLPVVFSPNPSMKRLLELDGLGVCAADYTAAALQQAIEQILFDRPRLRTIRARALEVFSERLCFEQAARPTVEAFHRLLAHAAPSA